MIDEGYPLQNTQGDPSNPGTTEPPTSATLRAFDAASYPNELYDSSQISTDVPGYGIKFTSPIVANGKVYISTGHDLTTVTNPKGEIDVYGLK
jgi:outer membrane protein assembly factor BamA